MKIEYIDGALLKKMFIGATSSLEKNKEMLNSLNVFPVPDGDTGTNMSLTMQSAVRELKVTDSNQIKEIANMVSSGSLMGARGNSGVILSQILRGFLKALEGKDRIDTAVLAQALDKGSKTAYRAVMKPIEGTILTVSRESAEHAIEASEVDSDIVSFLRDVINAGNRSLNHTPELLPVLKQAGVVDAGGKGFIVMLEGMFAAISGEEIAYVSEELGIDAKRERLSSTNDIEFDDIEFGYCTEFIIHNNKVSSETFASDIKDIGDSMMVVEGEGFIKVHVHTNQPGIVLDKALKVGELVDIKIDNMRHQHQNKLGDLKLETKTDTKEYGFVTVAMGDGIENIFKDLNADYIISGGQTMNPSTEDILSAIDKINATNIIVLPNNSNIILAANQASKISNKNVIVLPTNTIPEGITSLLEFNEELDLEDNISNMTDAFNRMKTSQVTFSVRDTILDGIDIKKGNILGISDGKLTSVGINITDVTLDLIDKTLDEDSELITIFYGNGIGEEDGKGIIDTLQNKYDNLDIELIYGGQPIYYYLIAVE